MDKFYEYFNIPKVEYREPGRVYDDDGELCEWYISEEYPSLTPVFFELLHYYYGNLHGDELPLTEMRANTLLETLTTALVERVMLLEQEHDMSDEKNDIKEIILDYIGDEYE